MLPSIHCLEVKDLWYNIEYLYDSFTGQLGSDLPLVGRDILVRAMVAQKVHDVQVVPLRRPVQRCPAVDVVLRVRVHAPEISSSEKDQHSLFLISVGQKFSMNNGHESDTG